MSTTSRTSIFHLLHRAAQRGDALLEAELKGGLTARQAAVLAIIADNPGANQTKIVDSTGIDRSTTAEMMKRLADRGLVKRARDRVDARAYRVQLTPKGEQALAAVEPAERRALDTLLSSLTQQHRKDVIVLLERLAGITDSAESGEGRQSRDVG